MNVSGGVLVERHRLQQDIVVIIIHVVREVNDFVNRLADFESVWVHMFADLALEPLPIEGADALVLGIWWLLLLLCHNPVFETLKVDKSYRSLASACDDKWVLGIIF